MTDEKVGAEKEVAIEPLSSRALEFAQRAWRPTGSAVAVCLALMLMVHVVNGRNGLTVWNKKRAEDLQLQAEIDKLKRDNAQLRDHVERLKSDPDAIEHEAREKLHYAKPNEVIVAMPPASENQGQPAGGK
jgi:cell division protein FtsB